MLTDEYLRVHLTTGGNEAERIFLALGSNLGDRLQNLQRAVSDLTSNDVRVLRPSSVYEGTAHVKEGQAAAPDFFNAVVEVRTSLSPNDLLEVVLEVETKRGRTRSADGRWEPRTLDIDIVAFGSRSITTDRLVIPHPRIADRRFVLQPLAEIAPDELLPPPISDTAERLLAACRDLHTLRKVHPPEALLPYPHHL